MKSNYLETQYYVAELQKGILYVQYKPMIQISLEDAKSIVAYRLNTFNDLQVPVLIRVGKIKHINKAARSYLFSEGLINVKAVALVEEQQQDKILATFLLGFELPKAPCRSFDNEEEAVAWLQQYV